MIRDKIQQSLLSAMREKNQGTVSTLRLIMSEIKNVEIDTKQELGDPEIIDLIQKQKKKLDQSIEMFQQAGRDDLISEYKSQIEIMNEYLPAQLTVSEIQTQLTSLLTENDSVMKSNPKALIGLAMTHFKGKADPKMVLEELRTLVPGV